MKYTGLAFFDMDGVLANCNHRLKWADKDYDKFYAPQNILKDSPIQAGFDLLRMFVATGLKVIIITSRRSQCKQTTREWLSHWGLDIPSEDIYCRSTGDTRKSWKVKLDLVEEAIQNNMDEYIGGRNYFVDDYAMNCKAIAHRYSTMQTIVFGCGRLDDEGGEL